MKAKDKDLIFLKKVLRNGLILSGLYFVSVFASGNLSYEHIKPIIIFLLGYVFTELARHFGLGTTIKKEKYKTMIFT